MADAPLERRRGRRRNVEPKRPAVLTCSQFPVGRLLVVPHGGFQVGVGLRGGERARHLMIVVPAVAVMTAAAAVPAMMAVAATYVVIPAAMPAVPVMMVAFSVPLRPVNVGPSRELNEDSFVALGLVHAQQDVAGDGRA